MKRRMKVIGLMSLAAAMVFWYQPRAFCGTATTEDILKRLNDLSDIIQHQQKEIERLKQDLKNQRKSIEKGQEVQKEEIKKAAKAETKEAEKSWRDSLPKWTERIKISADLRLRYERIWDRGMLNDDGSEGKQEARDRGRIRARIFLDGKITDELNTHFMITTNMDSHQEATTTNATFTNDFNDKGIYLARAYADYKPNWLKGLNIGGGKFRKNFYHTDIMWDPDVNPEGAYEMYRYVGSKIFQPFIYLSQMVVNENNTAPDAMLYLNQAGFDYIHNSADGVPSNEANAYCGFFKIGRDKKKGDYSLYYKYACIGQNAVVGSLNDQDFYGANRKGHKVALKYHPFKYTTLRSAFYYTDPVTTWKKAGKFLQELPLLAPVTFC